MLQVRLSSMHLRKLLTTLRLTACRVDCGPCHRLARCCSKSVAHTSCCVIRCLEAYVVVAAVRTSSGELDLRNSITLPSVPSGTYRPRWVLCHACGSQLVVLWNDRGLFDDCSDCSVLRETVTWSQFRIRSRTTFRLVSVPGRYPGTGLISPARCGCKSPGNCRSLVASTRHLT